MFKYDRYIFYDVITLPLTPSTPINGVCPSIRPGLQNPMTRMGKSFWNITYSMAIETQSVWDSGPRPKYKQAFRGMAIPIIKQYGSQAVLYL